MRRPISYAVRKVSRQLSRDIIKMSKNNTYIEYKPKEKIEKEDIPIILAWFISPILFIILIHQI